MPYWSNLVRFNSIFNSNLLSLDYIKYFIKVVNYFYLIKYLSLVLINQVDVWNSISVLFKYFIHNTVNAFRKLKWAFRKNLKKKIWYSKKISTGNYFSWCLNIGKFFKKLRILINNFKILKTPRKIGWLHISKNQKSRSMEKQEVSDLKSTYIWSV